MPELLEGKPFNPYGRFYNAWVPTQLLQSVEISDGAKLAYGLLRKFAGKDGACFPLQSTLARELGCKTRTVNKYIKELKGSKLIEVKRRGRGRSLSYVFLWKKELNSGQLFLPGKQDDVSLTRTNVQDVSGSGSGSLNWNSSSRACGNVEISGDHPSGEAIAENQEEEGSSERSGESLPEEVQVNPRQGKNGDAAGPKLARAGWNVVMLGNQTPQDTDVKAGLEMRNTIKELAQMKKITNR
jgi:biotin operon repressor